MICSPMSAQRRKDFRGPSKTKGCIPLVLGPTVSDDESHLPIISYDSDDTIPIASDDEIEPVTLPPYTNHRLAPSSNISGSLSSGSTPKTGQEQRDKAARCLVSIADTTLTWNGDWGPISNWSQTFAKQYVRAINENSRAAFIKSVEDRTQVGRQLMYDIAHVITDCTLPTSETALKAFVQLMLKLIFRLNKGILVLADRVRLVSAFPTN